MNLRQGGGSQIKSTWSLIRFTHLPHAVFIKTIFQTFLRQRTFYMPTLDSICDTDDRDAAEIARGETLPVGASRKWLRYLVHLR